MIRAVIIDRFRCKKVHTHRVRSSVEFWGHHPPMPRGKLAMPMSFDAIRGAPATSPSGASLGDGVADWKESRNLGAMAVLLPC